MKGAAMPDVNAMVFWGASGHAKVLRECMAHTDVPLVAVFDNRHDILCPFPDVTLHHGLAGFEQWYGNLASPGSVGFLVAVGGDKGRDRIDLHLMLAEHGLLPLKAIHPAAHVASDVHFGDGSQIMPMGVLGAGSSIGRSCIINTAASVDHECHLEDGVHVCPGARLGGCVTAGAFSTIGIGAVVLPRVTIGEGAVVGAGAVVIGDVDPYTLVAGNPARRLRKITSDEPKRRGF